MVTNEWSNTSGCFFAALCALRFSHITPLMYELHWFLLKQRTHFKIFLFVFKAIHGIARTYIQNFYGFRKHHSTAYALACLYDKISTAIENKEYIAF